MSLEGWFVLSGSCRRVRTYEFVGFVLSWPHCTPPPFVRQQSPLDGDMGGSAGEGPAAAAGAGGAAAASAAAAAAAAAEIGEDEVSRPRLLPSLPSMRGCGTCVCAPRRAGLSRRPSRHPSVPLRSCCSVLCVVSS